ncbi:protein TolQ [Salinisphaera sp. P385]|uniref:Tol-Pal system protein TolQ n=1 Tax=Spectribacter acetivorans TaxID=3075603 RepID=A0ABU3B4M9_9GAMM|nr:protein TolQ [Salinisphaera sp. P385]MDT0617411.1 protein TolQ [Salinisphaera sp. P385]
MNVATDLSLWGLIAEASMLVKLVMLGLLLASVASWVVILKKRRVIGATHTEVEWFEDRFWSGGNLNDIYREVMERGDTHIGLEALFRAGFEELRRQRADGRGRSDEILTSVQRAMRVSLARQVERLENGLALLATVGSTSPYIGLFGTVWGIMNAFIALGNVKQATLSMVAPGIAEALIATAMGLFAAIPAVIAYNFFTNRVDGLESRFQTFMEEFAGIVERGMHATPAQSDK